MGEMQHKEQPAMARKIKVMEIIGNELQEGKTPHSYIDLMGIRDKAVFALEEFYGARAVKNTFYAICKEKGWETKPAPAPKPEKNGLGARVDQMDARMSSGEAAVMEQGKRITELVERVEALEKRVALYITTLG